MSSSKSHATVNLGIYLPIAKTMAKALQFANIDVALYKKDPASNTPWKFVHSSQSFQCCVPICCDTNF